MCNNFDNDSGYATKLCSADKGNEHLARGQCQNFICHTYGIDTISLFAR